MKHYMVLLFFIPCLILATPLYAGNQTLTTYYPAPQGDYLNMTINQVLTMIADAAGCPAISGTNAYLVNVAGAITICDDTGTYTLSKNNLWLSNAGGTVLYPANLTENVGIGIAAPLAPLEIVHDTGVATTGVMLRLDSVSGSAGNGSSILFTNNGDVLNLAAISGVDAGAWGGYLAFLTSPNTGSAPGGTPTERMRINQDGAVSIGTTGDSAKLWVVGTGGVPNEPIRVQSVSTFFSAADAAGNERFAINNDGCTGTSCTALNFYGNDGVGTDWFNFMAVDNSGSREITLGSAPLAGVAQSGGLRTQGTPGFSWGGNAAGTTGSPWYGASPEMIANWDNHSGGGISISDDGGFFDYNDGWVTYNGSHGIKIAGSNGASSSDGALLLNQNEYTAIGNAFFSSGSSAATPWAHFGTNCWYDGSVWHFPSGQAGALIQLGAQSTFFWSHNGAAFTLMASIANGIITATGTASASDARLKENVVPLKNALSNLDQLRGVSYQWNHLATAIGPKEGQKDIGMIAQEVQKVYPELIIPMKVGDKEYLSVDYGKFSAVLLEAVKELKAQNNKMQDQIDALQDKVKILEKQK